MDSFWYSWVFNSHRFAVVVMASIELAAVLLHQILSGKFISETTRSLWIYYGITAIVYFGLLLFFYFNNYFFATNDFVYLVIMGKNLIELGFSQWYFSSPRGMGLFVPFLQTIGMVFGLDYVWFIQPVFMAIFIVLFFFFAWRAIKQLVESKLVRFLLVGLAILLFISSDLIFIMTTYIHTNFDSALFLFIAFCAIYFGFQEEIDAWFFFVPVFLIGFGALRTENVVAALILILIYVGSGKLSVKRLRLAFLPYLTFQFILNFRILFMKSETFSNFLSNEMIIITLVGIAAVAALLFLTEIKFLKKVILPRLWWLIPLGLLIALIGLGLTKFDQLAHNIQVSLSALLVTGNWDSFWWIILSIFLLLPFPTKFPQKREIFSYIWSFIIMIQALGMFRHPYHSRWYDSANRMLIHITPIVMFYLIVMIGNVTAKLKQNSFTKKKAA